MEGRDEKLNRWKEMFGRLPLQEQAVLSEKIDRWKEILGKRPLEEQAVLSQIAGEKSDDTVSFRMLHFDTAPSERQQEIKRFLARILPESVNWPFGFGERLAYVCADLEMDELRDQIVANYEQSPGPKSKRIERVLRVLDLPLPSQLRFMFTSPYAAQKSVADYSRFAGEMERLDPQRRQEVVNRIVELTNDDDPIMAKRATVVLALIDPERARPAAARLWSTPEEKSNMPKHLIRLLEGERWESLGTPREGR